MDRSVLSPAEVAAHLGITTRTLAQWRREGHGPHYVRPSRKVVRYRLEDVDQWLRNQAKAPRGRRRPS